MHDAKDVEHLRYAAEQHRVLVSSDADFLALDAEYKITDKWHAGIIHIPADKRNAIGQIVDFLLFLHQAVEGGAANLETDIYNRVHWI